MERCGDAKFIVEYYTQHRVYPKHENFNYLMLGGCKITRDFAVSDRQIISLYVVIYFPMVWVSAILNAIR